MVRIAALLQLRQCISRTSLNQSAQYVTAASVDDIFSSSHRQHCVSRLHPVEPGIDSLTPKWIYPGTGKVVENVRMAAVLVPLCVVNNQPSILFTLRSPRLIQHQGQVSFPGGMVESSDRDAAHTAIRETHEEIGLPMSDVDVWGRLNLFPSSGWETAVVPVIGFCGEVDIAKLPINKHEVDEVFAASLTWLSDAKNFAYTRYRGQRVDYKLPVFLTQSYCNIWGITATVLHNVLNIIVPEMYDREFSIYSS